MNKINELKEKQKALSKQIAKLENKQKGVDVLTADQFNDLRQHILRLEEHGIHEKVKIKIEFEVNVNCKLDLESGSLEECIEHVDNRLNVLKTNNKRVAEFLVECMENDDSFEYPVLDASKEAKKKFRIEQSKLVKKFADISKEVGIEAQELWDLVLEYPNLRQARKMEQ